MSGNLPKELNLASNKPMSANGKPYINRFRADNSSYSGGDVIRIEIPTGRQGTYLFPKDSFIEARVQLTVVDSGTSQKYFIDQSVYSLFNRIRVYHGSNIIEDTLYTNRLWTALYDLQVNEVERRGDCITKLVNDTTDTTNKYPIFQDGCNGQLIVTSSGTASTSTPSSLYDFAFVIPSAVLGSLCSKALPLGLMGSASIYLELELANANVAFVSSSSTNTSISYIVQDIYYNAKMTTLPSDINDALIESTGGFINVPAIAYKSEVKSIASGVTAFNDKFSYQFSSLKNFLFFFINTTTATGAVTKRSVSARPRANLSDFFLLINGEAFPSQTVANPSRMYAELMRAFDSLTDTNAGGILSYQNYTNSNTSTTADDVLNATVTNTTQKRFIAGIDLDKFNHSTDTLMSGTSSIGQMVNIQLNFSSSNTEALNLYSAVQYDVLYHIEGGLISPKF